MNAGDGLVAMFTLHTRECATLKGKLKKWAGSINHGKMPQMEVIKQNDNQQVKPAALLSESTSYPIQFFTFSDHSIYV